MLDKFKDWLKFHETGNDAPMPPAPDQARRPDLIHPDGDDGLERGNPMKVGKPTSAFQTFGGPPLPGNRLPMKKGIKK